ncbi:hypothetical protein QQ008_26675 [Fulvivirgaceae bacterium BMA10]|uniref:Uncharacterized protein n=1 Tax=Splendidivirga corallicola TaxID=3051826 RepID=A0ABT8KX82_9BACT|nr:hypothetical protein [Fulvivirgaceae bacterium BMA10]
MFNRLTTYTVFVFLLAYSLSQNNVIAQEQETDSLNTEAFLEELAKLEADLSRDSLTILDLLDSLLNMESKYSTLSFRVGFMSEVLSAGRDLNVKQYGFNPGITYYHKSGIFTDLTGFWNSEFDPKYNLTVLGIGYLGYFTNKWSYIFFYDHSFYSASDIKNPLKNSLRASTYLDFRHLDLGVDYSFLFGSETAHRLRGNVALNFKIKNVLFFDYVKLRPSFSTLFGNTLVTTIRFNRGFRQRDERPFIINEDNVFGLMNYEFSLPITATRKAFSVLFNYNYAIPKELPGENLELEPNGYFAASIIYTIGFRK